MGSELILHAHARRDLSTFQGRRCTKSVTQIDSTRNLMELRILTVKPDTKQLWTICMPCSARNFTRSHSSNVHSHCSRRFVEKHQLLPFLQLRKMTHSMVCHSFAMDGNAKRMRSRVLICTAGTVAIAFTAGTCALRFTSLYDLQRLWQFFYPFGL